MTSRKTTPQRASKRRANVSRIDAFGRRPQQRPAAARSARPRAQPFLSQPALCVAERTQRVESVGGYEAGRNELPQRLFNFARQAFGRRARSRQRTARADVSIASRTSRAACERRAGFPGAPDDQLLRIGCAETARSAQAASDARAALAALARFQRGMRRQACPTSRRRRNRDDRETPACIPQRAPGKFAPPTQRRESRNPRAGARSAAFRRCREGARPARRAANVAETRHTAPPSPARFRGADVPIVRRWMRASTRRLHHCSTSFCDETCRASTCPCDLKTKQRRLDGAFVEAKTLAAICATLSGPLHSSHPRTISVTAASRSSCVRPSPYAARAKSKRSAQVQQFADASWRAVARRVRANQRRHAATGGSTMSVDSASCSSSASRTTGHDSAATSAIASRIEHAGAVEIVARTYGAAAPRVRAALRAARRRDTRTDWR